MSAAWGAFALIIFVLLAAAIVISIRRLHMTHTIRKTKIRDAARRTAWPRRFGPWMLANEKVLWEGRKHPIAILRWWILGFGGPLASIPVGLTSQSWAIFFALLILPPFIAGWRILDWWLEWRVITDIRIVEVKGILNVRAPATRLATVMTTAPIKPFLSHYVLAPMGWPTYAHIRLETAAQVEANPVLSYVSNPEAVNALLQSHFASRSQSN